MSSSPVNFIDTSFLLGSAKSSDEALLRLFGFSEAIGIEGNGGSNYFAYSI